MPVGACFALDLDGGCLIVLHLCYYRLLLLRGFKWIDRKDVVISEEKSNASFGVKSRAFEHRRPGNWPLSVSTRFAVVCDRYHLFVC